MLALRYLNCAAFLVLLVGWAVLRLYDLSVPLLDTYPENLHSAIASADECPFSLNIENRWVDRPRAEVVVDGGRGASLFWSEKIEESFLLMGDVHGVSNWLQNQLGFYHLYEEVLSSEKFWVTFGCIAIINVAMVIVVFEPFFHLSKSLLMREELRRAEAEHMEVNMRKFVIEKILILGFVVIRTQQTIQREKILPVGILPRTFVATDASVFAIFYGIVWSVSSICSTSLRRFEGLDASVPFATRRTLNARLALVLVACVCGGASLTSLAVASLQIVHPLYAVILIGESLRILLQSMYAASRVISAGFRETNDASTSQKYYAKRMTDVLCDLLSAANYAMYMLVGTLLNGKLVPLCFVPRFTFHLARAFEHVTSHRRGEPAPKLLFD